MDDEAEELQHIIRGLKQLQLGYGLIWMSDIKGPMADLPDAAKDRLVADLLDAKKMIDHALGLLNL